MQINFTSKNVPISQSLQEYAEKKLSKLTKFFENINSIEVIFSEENWRDGNKRHIVEVTLDANGRLIKASEANQDFRTSIDLVIDKLEIQLKKLKGKMTERDRRSQNPIGVLSQETKEEKSKVVKIKRFSLKPMDVEEAILQMELLGHDFFLFLDADSDKISLLYRRKDGNYGLIITEEE
ncbi:MAG TPA: ribosome-associated translation inhibitor RaiA [Dictyoglomaceae bacterium]|nr:ribosome-associated translation inhibitor RaiA [Dictyoglomaceae bacterium]HOL39641.1 ribosome-associated translation inhibitor RaiA [Dictyoglomaceae bacterium]HOP95137.1 ribosome-associated translation inhibitor RaiA [Dictyoglomaceae bacterium]HPP15213.1 ribosome-associated translation inhibitor RaiA [Dictyoglomaceae bacterium]HPU42619.1 ribosome-associated translation inhibitor RaiA [Dictyoglomaceae bacterium]